MKWLSAPLSIIKTNLRIAKFALISILAVLLVFMAYGWYRFTSSEIDPRMEPLIKQASLQMANNIEWREGGIDSILVFPLRGDFKRSISDSLRAEISKQGKFEIIDSGRIGDAIRHIGVDLPHIDPDSEIERGASLANTAGIDGFICGMVDRWELTDENVALAFTIHLVRTSDQEVVASYSYDSDDSGSIRSTLLSTGRQLWKGLVLSILFVVIVTVLPLILWPITRFYLEQKSNKSSVQLLGILFLCNSLILLVLFNFDLGSWFARFVFCIGLLFAAFGSYVVTERIENTR